MLEIPRTVYLPGGYKSPPKELSFPFDLGAGKGVNVVWDYWKKDAPTGVFIYSLRFETARPLMPFRMETKTGARRWHEFIDTMAKTQEQRKRGNGIQ
jgi:hypothetical protein